jgi:hypothetical protein
MPFLSLKPHFHNQLPAIDDVSSSEVLNQTLIFGKT